MFITVILTDIIMQHSMRDAEELQCRHTENAGVSVESRISMRQKEHTTLI